MNDLADSKSRIRVVDLPGDAAARSLTLGSAGGASVQGCLDAWLASLKSGDVTDPRAYAARMLRETDFIASIRRHVPDLLEEVEATASAAGVPRDLFLASQFIDEEWAFRAGNRYM